MIFIRSNCCNSIKKELYKTYGYMSIVERIPCESNLLKRLENLMNNNKSYNKNELPMYRKRETEKELSDLIITYNNRDNLDLFYYLRKFYKL